jgi:hypothetical protein
MVAATAFGFMFVGLAEYWDIVGICASEFCFERSKSINSTEGQMRLV